MQRTRVLDKNQLNQKLDRLAWQIYENNYKEKDIIIAGIADRGIILAKMIERKLTKISKLKIKLVTITLDKDNPYSKDIHVDINEKEFQDKVIIIIDDVLNSGKTMMYAAKHFLSVPLNKLSTAVLVNRNHNLFPIKADFIGLSLSTTLKEHISVELRENIGVFLS